MILIALLALMQDDALPSQAGAAQARRQARARHLGPDRTHPSTFAVIIECFVRRNEIEGELDADKERDEKLEFKPTAPQGTAAVPGTRLSLRTSDVGLEAVGETGVADIRSVYGGEYRLGEHLPNLLSSIAADLAAMSAAARRTPRSDDHMLSDGDRSWAAEAFSPAVDANTIWMRVHGEDFCMPRMDGGINDATTNFDCGLFYRWELVWILDGGCWESVKGRSKIARVFYDLNKNEYWRMLRGRTVSVPREIAGGWGDGVGAADARWGLEQLSLA